MQLGRRSEARIKARKLGVTLAVAMMAALVPSAAHGLEVLDCATAKMILPGQDVQVAINRSPAGQSFCFAPGTHRVKRQLWPKANQRFIGLPGSIISGAEVMSFYTQGSVWISSGHTQQPTAATTPCAVGVGNLCNMPFRVFFDGAALDPVASLSELRPGTYFFDLATDNVYVADDPTGHQVELGLASFGMSGTLNAVPADGVQVRGLTWEGFANQRNGVISTFAARNWVIENNEVRDSAGCGIWAGSGAVVRGNFVHHMGQIGLCGQGEDILVENNEIAFNNTNGFNPRWEAGGSKWVNTQRLTVRNNYSHDNKGPGLWTDANNISTLYEGNVVERNTEEGIFHEISYDAVIRNNVVLSNGRNIGGSWGAGILVSSSPNVQIYGNVVNGGWNGVSLIQENRGSGNYGPFQLKNITVRDNAITMTKGSTGVFDTTGTGAVFRLGSIEFDGNRYTLGTGDQFFSWAGTKLTKKQWKKLGMDKKGSFRVRR